MMESRYIRNRIYLTDEEQEAIKNIPVILAGSGIGSVIAECALRLGFENLTIVDFDHVELSNLNRQNYTEADLFTKKVDAIKTRLTTINNNANIQVFNAELTEENVTNLVNGHKIAINALDFTSNVPLEFDKKCQENNIQVLHPYNLGWGGLVTVIVPEGPSLNILDNHSKKFSEMNMVEYASGYMRFWGDPQHWIESIIEEYKNEETDLSPPQLSVGSWLVASMCTHIMFNICTGKHIKKFPEFYFSTIMDNRDSGENKADTI